MNLKIQIKTIKHRAARSLFSALTVSLATASFNVNGEAYERAAKVSVSSESPVSIDSGSSGQFAMTKTTITLPLEDNTQRAESFKTSFHANITDFDWRGTDAASGDYIWLSMPMYYQQKRSNNTRFIVQAEPGLMTDGNDIGLDSIGINGSVMGRILWENGGYWQYGLMIDRAFGDYNVRPVLGIAFQADHKTWVELGFPKIRVTHNFSTDIVSYLTIKPAGGVWKETVDVKAGGAGDDAAGGEDVGGDAGGDAGGDVGGDAGGDAEADAATGVAVATGPQEMYVRYRSWQFGAGANFHWRETLWLNAEVGQLRNRRISAGDSSGAKIKATPSENLYWRVGASLKF